MFRTIFFQEIFYTTIFISQFLLHHQPFSICMLLVQADLHIRSRFSLSYIQDMARQLVRRLLSQSNAQKQKHKRAD